MGAPIIGAVLATLIAFLAGLEFINATLTWFGERAGVTDLTLQVGTMSIRKECASNISLILTLKCKLQKIPYSSVANSGMDFDACSLFDGRSMGGLYHRSGIDRN